MSDQVVHLFVEFSHNARGQEGAKMTINPIMKIIRAKKLGVLIRDARLKTGKSLEECAQAMGIIRLMNLQQWNLGRDHQHYRSLSS